MGRTIPTCKILLVVAGLSASSLAAAKTDEPVDRYAAARLAEIANREDEALKAYVKLSRDAPDSAVLADRIFDSAIRTGDMAAALRAVRAQELRGEVSSEAPLLLFADAFRRKNWPMALIAADELSSRSNLAFMAPILRSWTNAAQGKPHNLPTADAQVDPLFAYYAEDQRVYFELNAGELATAKQSLRGLAVMGADYTRDVLLSAAPVIRANGDDMFADALIGTAMGADRLSVASLPPDRKQRASLTPEDGLAAMHVRIASALLEQKIDEPALVLARMAIWYAPDSASANLVLAKALLAQGLDASALETLEKIPSTSPYWPRAIGQRVAQMEPTAALALARYAVQQWPKSGSLVLVLAQSQETIGDLDGAADSYRRIADAADKGGSTPRQRAGYRLQLARALDNAGNWAGARSNLDAGLVIDPNNAQILNYLGYSLLERQEDVPRAMAMIQRAFEVAPDSTAVMDSMGWAHFQTGNYAQAVVLLEKAAKVLGNDPAINEHLGDAYWRVGLLRDARYAWRVASQAAKGEAAARIAGKIDTGLAQAAFRR